MLATFFQLIYYQISFTVNLLILNLTTCLAIILESILITKFVVPFNTN